MKGIDQSMGVRSDNRRIPEGLFDNGIAREEIAAGMKTRPQVSSDSISTFLLMDPLVKEGDFQVRSHQDLKHGNELAPLSSLGDCVSDNGHSDGEYSLGQEGDGGQTSIWKVQLAASGLSGPTLEEWAMGSLNGQPGRQSTE